MSSEAQVNANRANAQHSTGPTSEAGRAKVSQNAVKTGLTGRTVVVPFGEADAYQSLMLDHQKQFQPVGPQETALVQSLTDLVWRLDRIPGLEFALLELGRTDMIKQCPELANNPTQMLEMQIRLHFEKQFRNLELQENRLSRRRERELKELHALQAERKAKETEELTRAAQACLLAQQRKQPFNPAENGFAFSTQQIESFIAKLTPSMRQKLTQEATQTQQAAA